jgi:hypothetical protein
MVYHWTPNLVTINSDDDSSSEESSESKDSSNGTNDMGMIQAQM